MKALISGGSGLVGTALTRMLLTKGYEVTHLSRSPGLPKVWKDGDKTPDVSVWNPSKGEVDATVVEAADVIFNLAGASVSDRWTDSHKRAIYDSRRDSTRTLVNALPSDTPKKFISASAIGIYPDSQELVTEDTPPAAGFLADVVKMWEEEALKASHKGHRVACLRIGLVLSEDGGALERLLPIFKAGVGSPVGNGQHWQSWIHIDDLAALFVHAAEQQLSGVYNAVAPQPVTNKVFSKALASALRKPFFMPNVPAFMLKLVFGEMSQIVLASNKVSAEKTTHTGFRFQFTDIDHALKDLVG